MSAELVPVEQGYVDFRRSLDPEQVLMGVGAPSLPLTPTPGRFDGAHFTLSLAQVRVGQAAPVPQLDQALRQRAAAAAGVQVSPLISLPRVAPPGNS